MIKVYEGQWFFYLKNTYDLIGFNLNYLILKKNLNYLK